MRAQQILEAGPPYFTGARNVCILSWSFEDESLWRGLSDNKKVIGLARSMVTTGYRQDEPIKSRTFDLTAPDGILAGKLLFGDGQARGLAVRLAFHFLVNGVRQAPDGLIGDSELIRIMQGLIQVPTVFTKYGEGSPADLIVAQAVRQNAKAAMQLPMNTMEWSGMVLKSCRLKLGVSAVQTAMIMQALERCTKKYDAHLEVHAYDMEPVAKRARKGRKKSAAATALAMASDTADGEPQRLIEPDDRIRIGNRRLQAISNVLSLATPKSYKTLQVHLVWAGDYAASALSDDILSSSFLWPNSMPPEEALADEATQIAVMLLPRHIEKSSLGV